MGIMLRALAAALLLAGILPVPHALAQRLPPGSYLRSCYEAVVVRGTLIGMCRRADGEWQQSVLPTVDRCVGDIVNSNGRLRCRYAALAPAPGGSYQQTCSDIAVSGTTLAAACRTRKGRTQRTSLANVDRCVGDIANIDGTLTCNSRR